MDTAALTKLIKCLEMTASDSDGEALSAVRKANSIKSKLQKTWTELMSPAPTAYNPYAQRPQSQYQPKPPERNEEAEEMIEELLSMDLTDSASDFVESLDSYYSEKGRLTPKQFDALKKIYARYCGA